MGFLSSIGGIVGGLVSTAFGGHTARQNATHNADLTRENWEYQQKNAHQFEVQDLRDAGLNPILSATNSQMAGMSPVSGSAVSDNGVASSLITSAVARENKKTDAEIEQKKLENDLLRIGIDRSRLDLDRQIGTSTINLNDAKVLESNSARDLNTAQIGYVEGQTSALAQMTSAQVRQIEQNIQNSIEITRATVAKYGAESEAAKASAALAYKSIQTEAAKAALMLSQKTKTDWDSNKVIKELSDPDSNLHRDYRNTPVGTILGYISEGIKDITPFRFGLGLRK